MTSAECRTDHGLSLDDYIFNYDADDWYAVCPRCSEHIWGLPDPMVEP